VTGHGQNPSPVLEVERISKRFKIYNRTADRLIESFSGKLRHRVHAALEDVTFALGQGEAIGVLGQNGAGKSTLLKLVSGVLMPDAGSIVCRGRIAGLLELGTGFDGKLSGRENIAVNARLIGSNAATRSSPFRSWPGSSTRRYAPILPG
jgi:lipopolysaccharide transport system ATP-binding protein